MGKGRAEFAISILKSTFRNEVLPRPQRRPLKNDLVRHADLRFRCILFASYHNLLQLEKPSICQASVTPFC